MEIRKIVIIIGALLIIGAIGYFAKSVISRTQAGPAKLKVTSNPQATVYFDDKQIGQTPYEDKAEAGEHTIKLTPISADEKVASWQGTVNLSPNVLTYINRDLGDSDLTSAGEILTLEKISGLNSQIAVITTPDQAQVKLDGQDKGAAPTIIENVSVGEHEIEISATGFEQRSIKVKTTAGYKLVTRFQLALTGEKQLTPQEEITPGEGTPGVLKETEEMEKPYVVIKDTPTGWLRVRMEPTTSSTEAAKVNPGEKYPYLDEEKGWYKIKLSDGTLGWISGTYAEKVE